MLILFVSFLIQPLSPKSQIHLSYQEESKNLVSFIESNLADNFNMPHLFISQLTLPPETPLGYSRNHLEQTNNAQQAIKECQRFWKYISIVFSKNIASLDDPKVLKAFWILNFVHYPLDKLSFLFNPLEKVIEKSFQSSLFLNTIYPYYSYDPIQWDYFLDSIYTLLSQIKGNKFSEKERIKLIMKFITPPLTNMDYQNFEGQLNLAKHILKMLLARKDVEFKVALECELTLNDILGFPQDIKTLLPHRKTQFYIGGLEIESILLRNYFDYLGLFPIIPPFFNHQTDVQKYILFNEYLFQKIKETTHPLGSTKRWIQLIKICQEHSCGGDLIYQIEQWLIKCLCSGKDLENILNYMSDRLPISNWSQRGFYSQYGIGREYQEHIEIFLGYLSMSQYLALQPLNDEDLTQYLSPENQQALQNIKTKNYSDLNERDLLVLTEIENTNILIDFNHPILHQRISSFYREILAGHTLIPLEAYLPRINPTHLANLGKGGGARNTELCLSGNSHYPPIEYCFLLGEWYIPNQQEVSHLREKYKKNLRKKNNINFQKSFKFVPFSHYRRQHRSLIFYHRFEPQKVTVIKFKKDDEKDQDLIDEHLSHLIFQDIKGLYSSIPTESYLVKNFSCQYLIEQMNIHPEDQQELKKLLGQTFDNNKESLILVTQVDQNVHTYLTEGWSRERSLTNQISNFFKETLIKLTSDMGLLNQEGYILTERIDLFHNLLSYRKYDMTTDFNLGSIENLWKQTLTPNFGMGSLRDTGHHLKKITFKKVIEAYLAQTFSIYLMYISLFASDFDPQDMDKVSKTTQFLINLFATHLASTCQLDFYKCQNYLASDPSIPWELIAKQTHYMFCLQHPFLSCTETESNKKLFEECFKCEPSSEIFTEEHGFNRVNGFSRHKNGEFIEKFSPLNGVFPVTAYNILKVRLIAIYSYFLREESFFKPLNDLKITPNCYLFLFSWRRIFFFKPLNDLKITLPIESNMEIEKGIDDGVQDDGVQEIHEEDIYEKILNLKTIDGMTPKELSDHIRKNMKSQNIIELIRIFEYLIWKTQLTEYGYNFFLEMAQYYQVKEIISLLSRALENFYVQNLLRNKKENNISGKKRTTSTKLFIPLNKMKITEETIWIMHLA